jgi:two-component system NarL family sensor kinase
LRNAEKHSGRRTFDVRLRGSNGTLELLIRDEGIGFDVEAARATRGIGLVTMEERITLAGGSLEVRSVPHQGTTIRAQVPVDRLT